MRSSLRRKFRDAAAHPPSIVMETVPDIAPYVDEIYPRYLQVYQKSPYRFELLTKDFIRELGSRMPDQARFFIWRHQGKAIGFSICMIEGNAFYSEYIGLDYSIALDVHLYFIMTRDLINWAIKAGFGYYCSTALSYDPKYHLRFDLEPLDLYVRHTSTIANWILQRFLFLLDPTRHDPILKNFENYSELSAG